MVVVGENSALEARPAVVVMGRDDDTPLGSVCLVAKTKNGLPLTGLQESGVPKSLHSWTAGEAEDAVDQTVTANDDRVL